MKSSQGYLFVGILFLVVAGLNVLLIDFGAIKFIEVLPAVLFLIAGLIYLKQYRTRKTQENG